jgi:hypothetical protein
MSLQFFIALTTGVLSGVWFWAASSLGLLVWAGFLGSTTYFTSPEEGIKGVILSFSCNMSGIFWAMIIINFSTLFTINYISVIITAIVAFFMCMQAKQKLLKFVPGTFIGACATFAADGNWKIVAFSMTGGLLMGYLMKSTGLWLYDIKNKTADLKAESPT